MYGLLQFAKRAEEEGIKPILGSLIDDPIDSEISMLILARNNEGYSKLCKIITTRKLKDDFRLIDLLKEDVSNLFLISSSPKLLRGAVNIIKKLPNFYVELIVTKRLQKNTRELYQFAIDNKIKFMASQPVYFETKEDHFLHRVVSAIRENSSIENIDESLLVDEEFYFHSPKEMQNIWSKLPKALKNLEYIVENCHVNLKFGEYKFPIYTVPIGENTYSYLWKLTFEGLKKRYQPLTQIAIDRLKYELEVIEELGFSNYFLIVWDIVREAERRKIITIGRGSAADSLVSYCLGFTQVDPIKHNLYFERFLNRGRKNPPDVDLDFSWKERDEIIKYVFDKYGYDKVAMISTTVTFRARSAFRETAKAFGIPNEEISKFSKFIPWTSAKNLGSLAEKFPEARSLDFSKEPWKKIIEVAARLSGFPRHLSIHPGGIVITPEPMTNYVALEYAKNKGLGLIVTQPDMYPIEDAGLIKIDLLSQRSLGVLRDTMNAIHDSPKSKI
jgi:DNA polymerase III alpha subunit